MIKVVNIEVTKLGDDLYRIDSRQVCNEVVSYHNILVDLNTFRWRMGNEIASDLMEMEINSIAKVLIQIRK